MQRAIMGPGALSESIIAVGRRVTMMAEVVSRTPTTKRSAPAGMKRGVQRRAELASTNFRTASIDRPGERFTQDAVGRRGLQALVPSA